MMREWLRHFLGGADDDNDEMNGKTTTTDGDEVEGPAWEDLPWPWIKAMNDILEKDYTFSPPELPVQLSSWLFLSNLHFAWNVTRLEELGITHVLTTNGMPSSAVQSMTKELNDAGIVHKYINGQDEEGYDMITNHWEECREFLQQVQSIDNGKVVIHCVAGLNRSGLISGAALLLLDGSKNLVSSSTTTKNEEESSSSQEQKQKQEQQEQQSSSFLGTEEDRNVLDVAQWLVMKRGVVLTNHSFRRQLCVLAQKHNKLGPRPSSLTSSSSSSTSVEEKYTDEPMEKPKRGTKPRQYAAAFDALAK